MANKNNRKSKSKKIAVGGIFAAFSLIVMLCGGFLPIATFAAPALSGLFLIPVAYEIDSKTAFIAYLSVSALSFFIIPDREMTFFFIFLMGYYPIIQIYFKRIKYKSISYFLKFLLFNASIVLIYFLLLIVFANPALLEEFSDATKGFVVFMLIAGNITFILYDLVIDKLRMVYINHFRKKLFRN